MKSTAELIDELSGLYTRKAFNQEIEKRIREKIPFSLFLIDIDYFKAINDNFGHLRGDEVIRDFSEWLRSQVDTELVFRLGGDEFAIIYSPPERSREIAERIKKNIKKRIFYGDPPLHLSLSIGFSVFPEDGNTAKEIFRIADERLFEDKGFYRGMEGRLVGRKKELSLLISGINEILTGKGKIMVISGLPGMGKSRLLSEIIKYSKLRGFGVHELRFSRKRENPFHALIKKGGRYGIISLFETISDEGPVLFSIEHLERAKGDFLRMLEDIADFVRKRRIGIILTCSRIPGSEKILQRLRKLNPILIELQPFSTPELERFIKERWAPGGVDEEILEKIAKRTGGVPLLVKEVIEEGMRRGIIRVKNGKLEGTGELPENIEDVWSELVDGVPESLKRVFYFASIMDPFTSIEDLVKVSGEKLSSVMEAMKYGLGTGILKEEEGFRFVNEFIRLSIERRFRKDVEPESLKRVAEFFYEREYFEAAGRIFEECGEREKTYECYIKGARRFIEYGGINDAMRLLKKAGRIKEDDMLYECIGDAYARKGEFEKALEFFNLTGNRRKTATCLVRMGRIEEAYRVLKEDEENLLIDIAESFLYLPDFERAYEYGKRALEKAQEPEDVMRAHAAIGAALWGKGDYEGALFHFTRGLNIALTLRDEYWEALLYNRLGVVKLYENSLAEAEEFFRKAERTFRMLGEISSLLQTRLNIGIVLEEEGRYQEAVEVYEASLELARILKDRLSEAKALERKAYIKLLEEKEEEALSLFEESYRIKKGLKFTGGIGVSHQNLGWVYFLLGNTEKARNHTLRALNIFSKIQRKDAKDETLVLLFLIYTFTSSEKAKRLIKKLPDTSHAHKALSLYHYLHGKKEKALEHAGKAIEMDKKEGKILEMGEDYIILSFVGGDPESERIGREIIRRCGIERCIYERVISRYYHTWSKKKR